MAVAISSSFFYDTPLSKLPFARAADPPAASQGSSRSGVTPRRAGASSSAFACSSSEFARRSDSRERFRAGNEM
jgi:hypothetical protein